LPMHTELDEEQLEVIVGVILANKNSNFIIY